VPRTDGVISLPSGLNQAPLLCWLFGDMHLVALSTSPIRSCIRCSAATAMVAGLTARLFRNPTTCAANGSKHPVGIVPLGLDCKWIELGRLIRRSSGMGGEIMNTSAMAFRRALGHAAQA
jgi:hypothetical protein